MAYTGTSIVDYLKSVGQGSDYTSRQKLAQEQGINNYTGTAQQNTQLLGSLNKPKTPTEPTEPTTTGWQSSPFEQGATYGPNLDKFIPEADDNINVDEGTESLLKGGQSDWFKTFQDAYVTGQNTIQQSIVKLMQQQADLTEETRQGYQANIDKATTGLEEAKDKPYGEELGEELSEKYKLQEKIDKLGEIGNQMAQLQGAYDASVAKTEMSGITIGQSRGELSRKQREYASKATVLQAQAAVVTDQYNLVRDLVEKYYISAESERTAEISRYQNLLDVATQAKLALTADDKNQITNQINLLLGEQTKQEANKDKIMALAINPATAEAFFNSGASFDDSYEAILEKMSPFMSAYAKEKRVGTGDTTTTDTSNVWLTADGTEIDPTTIAGVKYLADQDYSYGEIYTWYDVNMPSMTTGAIKALLKDAGLKETEIVNEATFDNLSQAIIKAVKKDSSKRDSVNAMLDNNQIVSKGKTYPLTQAQSDQIRNAIKTFPTKVFESIIKKPFTETWDWVKGIFK